MSISMALKMSISMSLKMLINMSLKMWIEMSLKMFFLTYYRIVPQESWNRTFLLLDFCMEMFPLLCDSNIGSWSLV